MDSGSVVTLDVSLLQYFNRTPNTRGVIIDDESFKYRRARFVVVRITISNSTVPTRKQTSIGKKSAVRFETRDTFMSEGYYKRRDDRTRPGPEEQRRKVLSSFIAPAWLIRHAFRHRSKIRLD